MGCIQKRFDHLRSAGKKGFIPFVTAGDPTLPASLSIIRKLAEAGADVIELGVPFSDPMADGPTIQRSSQRALNNGTSVSDVLNLAREFRSASDVPIVLFSYLNPLLSYGIERLATDASKSGIDGILITDAVDEEAQSYRRHLATKGIDFISLVAPTTSDTRLQRICRDATGFLYAVSRAGVTGERADVATSAEHLVSRARVFTDIPVAVGFGISNSLQVEDVWRYADAAIVGSAIVAEIERNIQLPTLPEHIREFAGRLLPSVAKTQVET
jgi:tryptophan synthase alpha chain